MEQKLINGEISAFENDLKNFLTDNKIGEYLYKFIFSKSKRLRPLLGILFTKSVGAEITENHKILYNAVELIHSASLIHDDVIDEAEQRRGEKSLNSAFDNSLAVTSGDLLLALGLKLIVNLPDKKIQEKFTNNMIELCHGEINQYFSRFELPETDKYIEKSKQKTSLLFDISLSGSVMLSGREEYLDTAEKFAENFGIAFQIKNDLKDHLTSQEDYKQGVYTAPVIFGIEKTKELMNNYLDRAVSLIKNLPENDYSKALISITEEMRKI